MAIKVVEDLDEVIKHIAKYGTKHSESIITENYSNAQRFLNEVDAAAVYVNASTRFTDGGQFGFGAEIGISTQKLHARGPMGLKELTTTKYVIMGNGQVEVIKHIAKYGTKHSESIITENYSNAQRFLNEVDAAAVYVNASTRFTDGGQFGFGAEIGISTQKLHARGPMGLKELTTTKYVIMGNGQVRE